MKEYPVLFNDTMVKAIQEGQKTMQEKKDAHPV